MTTSSSKGSGAKPAAPRKRLLEVGIPAEPGAVRLARAEVEKAVRPHVSRESLAALRLLVSEVVTNAVRRGNPEQRVNLSVDIGDAVYVDVVSPTPATADEAGYGLYIVTQLADDWGIDTDSGTRVWFSVPLWPNG